MIALNLVAVGNALVCGGDDAATRRLLHGRGFVCISVELDQFHLSGGSEACLATRVHRDPCDHREARGGDELDAR
jgi:hypothetical protein